MLRRIVAVGPVACVLAFCPNALAAVQSPVPIGPNQAFSGLVDGAASNATIQMACFGPTRPGQVGHPFAGQPLEVQLASAGGSGFTGQAHQIDADFASPSPSPSVMPPTELLATFSDYYASQPIPTSATFPCWGSGTIEFTPVDGGPLARSATVNVDFVGQP
jgi:hypothetical protein